MAIVTFGFHLAKNVVTVRGLDTVAETTASTLIALYAVSMRAGGQFGSAAYLCSPEQPLAAKSNPTHSAMPLSIEPGAVQLGGQTLGTKAKRERDVLVDNHACAFFRGQERGVFKCKCPSPNGRVRLHHLPCCCATSRRSGST